MRFSPLIVLNRVALANTKRSETPLTPVVAGRLVTEDLLVEVVGVAPIAGQAAQRMQVDGPRADCVNAAWG
jgi:hypothetical protein